MKLHDEAGITPKVPKSATPGLSIRAPSGFVLVMPRSSSLSEYRHGDRVNQLVRDKFAIHVGRRRTIESAPTARSMRSDSVHKISACKITGRSGDTEHCATQKKIHKKRKIRFEALPFSQRIRRFQEAAILRSGIYDPCGPRLFSSPSHRENLKALGSALLSKLEDH